MLLLLILVLSMSRMAQPHVADATVCLQLLMG
jgi:hypothetical protein